MKNAENALQTLKVGNGRYVANACDHADTSDAARRSLANGQQPFAIVLGCADSRVPVETIFDQGLGDLFVIRVAGNIVSPAQLGSVEFAVHSFNTPLVVVLGHSKCGAIAATLDSLSDPDMQLTPSLSEIVSCIAPAITPVANNASGMQRDELMTAAITANVKWTVQQLQAQSELLSARVEDASLKIVGAEYSLDSGEVSFY